MDAENFKACMAQLAGGVTVVTARLDEADHGFTATSFTSVSLDPRMVLVCVSRGHRGYAALRAAGHFAVNILAEEHEALAMKFAVAPPDERWKGVTLSGRAPSGAALFPEALAWVDCALAQVVEAGDHGVFLGQVLAGEARGGSPLVYHARRFGRFVASSS